MSIKPTAVIKLKRTRGKAHTPKTEVFSQYFIFNWKSFL